jgi:hypothetical protein
MFNIYDHILEILQALFLSTVKNQLNITTRTRCMKLYCLLLRAQAEAMLRLSYLLL